jgi:predicted transcriptional regulator
MDKIIEIQQSKLDSLYQHLDDLMGNLNKASNFDNESLSNFIDKLRLMNKSIDSLKDEINNLLNDLKNAGCKLGEEISQRLNDEEETNRMVEDLAPLILYYQLNRLNGSELNNQINTISNEQQGSQESQDRISNS